MMPAPRKIVLGCAARALILPASRAGAAATTAHPSSAKVAVPASAGKLTQGPIHYMCAWGMAPNQLSTNKTATTSVDTRNDLVYGGGCSLNTISCLPAVYIVFWGSQWNQNDNYAKYLQNFLKG